jgi:hypothetical protein
LSSVREMPQLGECGKPNHGVMYLANH